MTTEERVAEETDEAGYERTLDDAVAAAAVLAAATPDERAGWLDAIATALDAAADRLVPIAIEESHLAEPRLRGELTRTTFQLRLFGEALRAGRLLDAVVDHADPAWGMGPRPDLRRVLIPLGPAAVYAASNFPFAFSVAGGDTAAALAAGCPVVVKVHPGHPRLSSAVHAVMRDALVEAGAPAGAVGLVSGFDTGRRLVLDPRIAVGAFTGSPHGGRALFDLAAGRPVPIPFYAEMGSVNPAVVTRAAAAARAGQIADGYVDSIALGVGQFCTKPGLLFVPAGSGLPELIAERAAARAGAPMLDERLRDAYGEALGTVAAHPEVRVLAGSAAPAEEPSPTVLATTAAALLADPEGLTGEVFGPTALVVEYGDDDELLAALGILEGQLTATIQGEGPGEADEAILPRLLDVLTARAGRIVWNGWPTGVSVTWAMQHGGPYPATTFSGATSVGMAAVQRFLRPVAYQGLPDALLPPALRESNPWRLPRTVDGAAQPA
jgi:NADP-dependent aldehyde dehydrogenase